MENLLEYELITPVQHRDGWHGGKLRKFTTVLCLNAQNQLWTAHRLMSELNDELNGTLNYKLNV